MVPSTNQGPYLLTDICPVNEAKQIQQCDGGHDMQIDLSAQSPLGS